MSYKEETQRDIIDAKIMLRQTIYDDEYHATFDALGISRDAIRRIEGYLGEIIDVHGMDYDLRSAEPSEYDVSDEQAVFSLLGRAYGILNGIEDPWFWTEEEDAMGEIVQTLAAELDIAD